MPFVAAPTRSAGNAGRFDPSAPSVIMTGTLRWSGNGRSGADDCSCLTRFPPPRVEKAATADPTPARNRRHLRAWHHYLGYKPGLLFTAPPPAPFRDRDRTSPVIPHVLKHGLKDVLSRRRYRRYEGPTTPLTPKPASGRLNGASSFDGSLRPDEPPDGRGRSTSGSAPPAAEARPAAGAAAATGTCVRGRQGDTVGAIAPDAALLRSRHVARRMDCGSSWTLLTITAVAVVDVGRAQVAASCAGGHQG